MKRIVGLSLVLVLLAGCSSRSGELTGVLGRPVYVPRIPLGMVYMPSGSYNMGQSDEDVFFSKETKTKTVSIQALYMDQTEISNNEYRQFVSWVRDSMAMIMLYEEVLAGQIDLLEEEDVRDVFKETTFWDDLEQDWVFSGDIGVDELREKVKRLNWDFQLDWADRNQIPYLQEMYYKENERWLEQKRIDVRKLMYQYEWYNVLEAARRGRTDVVRGGYNAQGTRVDPDHRNLKDPLHDFTGDPQGLDKDLGNPNKLGQNNAIRWHDDRSRFFINETINVYPDTLVWVRDFTYSFNDPMTHMYYWHPGYDNYPLIGVTWQQARAFCVWRTRVLNDWLNENGELIVNDFRLPTEAEWERGARGDLDGANYPWGNPYIRNASGCFLGNFKPMRGRYFEDGGFHTVKVYSYNPNGWGLYCMAGNVSEWTETHYDPSMYEHSHDLNSEYRYNSMDWDVPVQKRKVIRGGSWKDVSFYLQTGSRTYEYQDTAKSYVGFRCVQTHIGRGGRDFENESSDNDVNVNF